MSDEELKVFIKMITYIVAKAICSWCHYSKDDECIKPSSMGDTLDSEIEKVVEEWISIRDT